MTIIPPGAMAPVAAPDRARVMTIMEKVRQIEIRIRGLVDNSLAGSYQAAFRGRGLDFDRVREYVAGDEVRTIAWNVTARAGRPFRKAFREEREHPRRLRVDSAPARECGSTGVAARPPLNCHQGAARH